MLPRVMHRCCGVHRGSSPACSARLVRRTFNAAFAFESFRIKTTPFMQRPLLPLLIAVMAGIASGLVLDIPRWWLTAGLIAGLGAMLFGAWKGLKYPIMTAAMFVMFVLSILNINLYLYENPGPAHIVHYTASDPLTVEGLISAPPRFFPDKTQLIVASQRLRTQDAVIPVNGNILLNVVTDEPYRYGQLIRFKARLKLPHNFHNPGGFDYERALRFRGILVHGFINNPSHIIVLREGQGHPLRMRIEAFRNDLKTLIQAYATSPAGDIIQALILGDQKDIPKEIRDRFNRTGTAHIIAISGFHVGIIAFFSILLVRTIMKTSPYLLLRFNIVKVSLALSFIPIAVFTLIAGMGISVVRAAIMAMAFLVAVLLGKNRDLYNTLALAGLVILVVYPPSLFEISFQLSFSAVAAILFITPKLTALIPKPAHEGKSKVDIFMRRRLHDIALFMIVSVSATLGTLPLVVFYFNRVSLITLPANLVVVPILGILTLPVCVGIIAAAPFSTTLAVWLIKLSAFLADIALSVLAYFASISWASFYVVTPDRSEIIACYLLLWISFTLLDRRTKRRHDSPSGGKTFFRREWMLGGALAGLIVFLFGYALQGRLAEMQSRDLRVTAIDVGQGSATFARFPGGKTMLVDGGGFFNDDFDIGRSVVAPFLWNQKVHRIDIVVVTHVHPDHLNGLRFVVANFDVGEVWSSGHESNDESFLDFKKIVSERSIPWRFVSAASPPLSVGDVHVRILNPADPVRMPHGRESFEDINNLSVVTMLTYGEVGILLPADISEPTEKRSSLQGMRLHSDVLFVPHHGGLTSSTEAFLDTVRPRVAVVSCGRDNIFRLPHPDVVDRYQARKIPLMRTDRDGAVTVATDGQDLRIHSARERR
jgi:competence protein ComEC